MLPLRFAILTAWLPLLAQFQPGGGFNNGGLNNGGPRIGSKSGSPGMFIRGLVILEDGGAIPSPISIIGGCRGSMQLLGYTDMKGHFNIDVKAGGVVGADAESSGISRSSALCEVSAKLDGYRSNVIDLTRMSGFDGWDIGTILLHRNTGQEGSTVSLTSLEAPKSAKRAFDKGMELWRKNRLDQAAGQFQKAVALYPKYADAWYRLGHVEVQKDDTAAGQDSFAKAIAADPKLVPPYVELAALSVNEGKWREALEYSRRAIKLDSFGVPAVYYFDALANFNLHNWDATERSARQLEKLDTQHRYIRINRILGTLLAAKNDYAGAVEQLREYLKFAVDAKDADQVRTQLAELEKRLPL